MRFLFSRAQGWLQIGPDRTRLIVASLGRRNRETRPRPEAREKPTLNHLRKISKAENELGFSIDLLFLVTLKCVLFVPFFRLVAAHLELPSSIGFCRIWQHFCKKVQQYWAEFVFIFENSRLSVTFSSVVTETEIFYKKRKTISIKRIL